MRQDHQTIARCREVQRRIIAHAPFDRHNAICDNHVETCDVAIKKTQIDPFELLTIPKMCGHFFASAQLIGQRFDPELMRGCHTAKKGTAEEQNQTG